MFVEAVLIGLLLGYIRRGRLGNISFIKIRGWFLIPIAFLIQVMPIFLYKMGYNTSPVKYTYIISMAMVIIVVLLNFDKKSSFFILLGVVLNIIPVVMNDFKMPIYFEGLRLAGLDNLINAINDGTVINYIALEDVENWTKHLGKFIVFPKPYPLAKVVSIGDLILSLGIILFIQGEMTRFHIRGRMVSFKYNTKI